MRQQADSSGTSASEATRIHESLADALRYYIEKARPALLSHGTQNIAPNALWIGDNGGPIGPQTIRKIIQRRTFEGLGRSVNPHSFRHAAATTYATEVPERAMEASAILSRDS